jgi:hypothetical protein
MHPTSSVMMKPVRIGIHVRVVVNVVFVFLVAVVHVAAATDAFASVVAVSHYGLMRRRRRKEPFTKLLLT